MDSTMAASDMDTLSDGFLFSQNDEPEEEDCVFRGLLLSFVRIVIGICCHRPDCRIPSAAPVTAIRRSAQHDRQPVVKIPVPTSVSNIEHVRRHSSNVHCRRQINSRLYVHYSEVSGSLLSIFHLKTCSFDDHPSHERFVHRCPILV